MYSREFRPPALEVLSVLGVRKLDTPSIYSEYILGASVQSVHIMVMWKIVVLTVTASRGMTDLYLIPKGRLKRFWNLTGRVGSGRIKRF